MATTGLMNSFFPKAIQTLNLHTVMSLHPKFPFLLHCLLFFYINFTDLCNVILLLRTVQYISFYNKLPALVL